LVFVDVSENLVMADDVVMPLNPLVAPVEEEELEGAPLDMNVSQRSHNENLFRKVVRIRVNCLAWDRQSSLNSHTLAIYLEFVPAYGVVSKRFEECQCEDNDVCLHFRTWVPSDGHYRWLQGLVNSISIER
jgi:hypothetical protein